MAKGFVVYFSDKMAHQRAYALRNDSMRDYQTILVYMIDTICLAGICYSRIFAAENKS